MKERADPVVAEIGSKAAKAIAIRGDVTPRQIDTKV